jgi:fructose-bisphosphate aldolase class 1
MTYSYGRALQQSALKILVKRYKDIEGTQRFLIIELK